MENKEIQTLSLFNPRENQDSLLARRGLMGPPQGQDQNKVWSNISRRFNFQKRAEEVPRENFREVIDSFGRGGILVARSSDTPVDQVGKAKIFPFVWKKNDWHMPYFIKTYLPVIAGGGVDQKLFSLFASSLSNINEAYGQLELWCREYETRFQRPEENDSPELRKEVRDSHVGDNYNTQTRRKYLSSSYIDDRTEMWRGIYAEKINGLLYISNSDSILGSYVEGQRDNFLRELKPGVIDQWKIKYYWMSWLGIIASEKKLLADKAKNEFFPNSNNASQNGLNTVPRLRLMAR